MSIIEERRRQHAERQAKREADISQAKKLRDSGMSIREIAKAMNKPESTILYSYLKS